MAKIVIIGAGFGGLAALDKLCSFGLSNDILLIDKTGEFNFLPMLPDIVGAKIKPDNLIFDVENLSWKRGFKLAIAEVTQVDLERKEVITAASRFPYDYLIIASGSETDFYNNEQMERAAYKLDNVADARKIKLAVIKNHYDSYFICGGGYTGIEIATNLKVFLKNNSIVKRVVIIEKANAILGQLPRQIRTCVAANLKSLGIEVITGFSAEKISARDNAMLIWAAGVRTAEFIRSLKAEKNPQGRVKVDKYLRLTDTCFIIGDAAYFEHKGNFLRMAVQFSIMQGRLAAINVSRSIKGKRLKCYRPVDLGYFVPMANNIACGKVLGFNTSGPFAQFLHYAMCVYRSRGLKNKLGIIKDLMGN